MKYCEGSTFWLKRIRDGFCPNLVTHSVGYFASGFDGNPAKLSMIFTCSTHLIDWERTDIEWADKEA